MMEPARKQAMLPVRIVSCFWFALAILVTTPVAGGTEPSRKPNFVFILSDDIAQGDLGCYGQKLIQTPRLDQMAAEGTRYLQTYCGTSVCAPSRSSFFTGLHTGHCPVRGNYEVPPEGQLPLPDETVTIAEVAKSADYATATFGKWGMGFFDTSGSPFNQGVDHFFGYNCQRHAHSYFPTYLYNDAQPFLLPGNDGETVGETYAQDLIQNDMIRWVREHAAEPFFLFYAITLPHGRHEIDDYGIYRDQPWTDRQKAYAAQVTRVDSDVGELMDTLRELGIAEDTLVVFSGDNGSSFDPKSEIGRRFNQASNGLRGFKRGMYEGALRQAAFAWWPGTVPAGRLDDQPWAFWDLMPTFVEMCGAVPPAGYETDGRSLVSYLKGGAAPQRDYFYWELHPGNRPIQAARFDHWKAVRNGIDKPIEVYDLSHDAAESQDLAASRPDLVTRASEIFKEAHRPDPNWPLDHRPKAHTESATEAWKIKRQRDKEHWIPADAVEIPDKRVSSRTLQSPLKELAESEQQRLNVLLICVDDLRPELACYGVSAIRSPNIDRLASSGRLFRRHYVQAPTCGASRYTLLTGRYGRPGNNALFQRSAKMKQDPKAVAPSMPAWFRQHGYTTVSVGKVSHHPGGRGGKDWNDETHLEMPNAWDRHLLPAGPWQHPRGWMHGLANGEIRVKAGDMDVFQALEGPDSIYPDGVSIDEALRQVDELASRPKKPFFLAVGILRPHLPFGAPAQYLELYAEAELPPTPHPIKPKGRTTWHASGEFMKYNRWNRDPNQDAEFALAVRKHYAACVSYADAQVGRLLEKLEKTGAAQNTIVILWGDHGWHLGEHAIWGKHTLFEESLRSPLIVSYAGMDHPGVSTEAIVETLDLFPTLCDLTGLPSPDFVQGVSLSPLLRDPKATGHPAIAYQGRARTIRTHTHRLILHDDGYAELYDHTTAAKETRNTAAMSRKLVEQLTQRLQDRLGG